MTTPKPIADQLREAIAASGKDMATLARMADVPYTSVHRFMVKGASLKVETAEALVIALGLKLKITK
jgi:DNA-binding phage protein